MRSKCKTPAAVLPRVWCRLGLNLSKSKSCAWYGFSDIITFGCGAGCDEWCEWCGGAVRVVRWCGVGGAAVRCEWCGGAVVRCGCCSGAVRVVQWCNVGRAVLSSRGQTDMT